MVSTVLSSYQTFLLMFLFSTKVVTPNYGSAGYTVCVMYTTHTAYYEEIVVSVKAKTSFFFTWLINYEQIWGAWFDRGSESFKRSCVTKTLRATLSFLK